MAITQRTLMERIDRFIRSIENRTGEPDQWEGLCVKQALVDLNAGDVERAQARIILARTPPQLRTSHFRALANEWHRCRLSAARI
jgi:hypothetical protein